MWDLPGPGLEPVSLALAGGFLTTAPPGEIFSGYMPSSGIAESHGSSIFSLDRKSVV